MEFADGLVISSSGSTCIALWRSQPVAETVARQRAAVAAMAQKYPGEATFLCVVEDGTDPPEEEARRASSAMLDEEGHNLRHVACVIEGRGFRAAVTRMVLTGIVRLSRCPVRVDFFASVVLAARRLDKPGVGADADAIKKTVDDMRRRFDQVHAA